MRGPPVRFVGTDPIRVLSQRNLSMSEMCIRDRVNPIVLERRGISADTTLRRSRFFATTEQFWLNLQSAYEVRGVMAQQAAEIERIQPRAASASRSANGSSLRTLSPLRSRPLRHNRRRNPAPRTKFPSHLRPHRLRPLHHILHHLVDDILLKNPQIPVALQILLQRFQLQAVFIRHISNRQMCIRDRLLVATRVSLCI